MKRFLIALFAVTVGLGLTAHDAEAKRLGGGKSSGISRDTGAMKQATPAPGAPTQNAVPAKPAATPQAPAPQPSGMSRWLGPIAGIAAGIGLAALLSHFGLGEGFASILMVALLVFAAIFVVRLLLRKRAPEGQMQYAGAGAPAGLGEPVRFEPAATPAGGGTGAGRIPAGFDTEGFLRQAKLNFIRLQAANDAGNMDDVANFTSPEMFAEIKMQFDERGRSVQRTDVVQLNAELLDVTTEAERHVASVRFFGQIREEEHSGPEAFDEIWHLTKPAASGGWVVAGIQQTA
ncbi:MAG: Tim44 domain-containing protein [Rhodocyclaceae bacterium]|nr:Tim44 domain-containing protein [Rhodocyclaceae bacterium]